MKIKSFLAVLLACALAFGLFACVPEEEIKEQVAKTSLAEVQADPAAYLNYHSAMLKMARSFTMETSYGMGDIEIGNSALQAARNVVKGYITSYLNHSLSYSIEDLNVDYPALYPGLFNALQAGDLPEGLVASDVLELRVAERLANLEKDIADGRNTSMNEADAAEKRQYVLDQMGESAVREAQSLFQIEGNLSLASVDKLLTPGDKADILAQLAKAKDFLVIEDYTLTPTEFTLFAQVSKAYVDKDKAGRPTLDEDHLKELTFTLKSDLTASARGAGAFEGEGEFPITLTLTKTVKYKDITWKAEATQ